MRKLKESIINSVLSVIILSITILAAAAFFIYQKRWIGLIFIAIGLVHIVVLRFFSIKIRAVLPDIIFGAIDNGVLVIGAIIGADFAGILGAIIGGAAANAITDGLAGLFEGWNAQYLRKHNIKGKRTALSSSVGKMAGCMLGAGIVLIVAWGLFSL